MYLAMTIKVNAKRRQQAPATWFYLAIRTSGRIFGT